MSTNPIGAFHAHLDECEWCEKQPFNLCPTGLRLLGAAAGQTETTDDTLAYCPSATWMIYEHEN